MGGTYSMPGEKTNILRIFLGNLGLYIPLMIHNTIDYIHIYIYIYIYMYIPSSTPGDLQLTVVYYNLFRPYYHPQSGTFT
jgi:ABC-type arginine/histidine transport system permease subunit